MGKVIISVILVLLLQPAYLFAESWQTVRTFSGRGDTDQETTTFTIRGQRWRIRWNFTKDISGAFVVFGGNAHREGSGRMAGSFMATEPGSGQTVIRSGPDDYYLKIAAGNVASWQISIEDYR